MKKRIKVSDCHETSYSTQEWVSKTIRRVRYCDYCGKPCRIISKWVEKKDEKI